MVDYTYLNLLPFRQKERSLAMYFRRLHVLMAKGNAYHACHGNSYPR